MYDLTLSEFNKLAAQIAKLNNLTLDDAEDALVVGGDAFETIDDEGKVLVEMPDGRMLRLIWPDF